MMELIDFALRDFGGGVCRFKVDMGRGGERKTLVFVVLPNASQYSPVLPSASYRFLVLPSASWYFPVLPNTSEYFLVLPSAS